MEFQIERIGFRMPMRAGVLQRSGLAKDQGLDEEMLASVLFTLEDGYQQNNPYHNRYCCAQLHEPLTGQLQKASSLIRKGLTACALWSWSQAMQDHKLFGMILFSKSSGFVRNGCLK